MLNIQIGGIHCKISLLFPAVLLLLLVGDDTGIACYSVLAAFLHECGHLIALCVCRGTVETLTISFYGMRLSLSQINRLSVGKAVTVYAAGPLVNILLCITLFILKGNTVVALIHACLAAMNCLPIMPLDGGQTVSCILHHVLPLEKAENLMKIISLITWSVMMLMGVMMLITTETNATLLITAVYVGVCTLFYKGN